MSRYRITTFRDCLPVLNATSHGADKAFEADAHRQSMVVARSSRASEDQAFIDAVSIWHDYEQAPA
ncbi:hypothetical protein [Azospirillum sp.]|uniref:hypothetical protein n=1 Tax=Azospirillum sp. TaxID=34012 RepID=UPI002D52FBB0|nr:hypothetical protein [Azospirillum sp.]HYD68908.1 hypothetical protein [Azospirillum sp.]